MEQIKLALAGNPNSGKTTLFNALTGSNQYVGNWPGVTVEKKEGHLKTDKSVMVTDLPGIYSLSPYSPEEIISRDYIAKEKPDAIINIVDASNLERNLYLTTQVMEMDTPVVVALNMMDIVRKNGDDIKTDKLEKELGVPVVEISALKGEGIDKLIEKAKQVARNHQMPNLQKTFGSPLAERSEDEEDEVITARYDHIASVIGRCLNKKKKGLSTSDKIDRIVTNRWLALPIFAVVMFAVYWIAMGPFGTFLTDWTNDVLGGAWLTDGSRAILESIGCADWLTGLISDGIFAGVGAVLGFVPQMLVLFILLAILEYCGYMARIAFILDRIFRRFGLSGKSFIPMLVGTGCGVPGVMASRTIENERDRRMTVMTCTFIPCGAKMPIIGLIAGAVFGGSALIAVSAYFIGIAAIIVSGIILKKTKPFAGEPSPFVMELPAYHMPTVGSVLRSMWERGWSFIKRAGTVILLSSIIIWALSSLGTVNGKFGMVDDLFEDETLVTDAYVEELAAKRNIAPEDVTAMDDSILAGVGNVIAPIFRPLGFGSWKPSVATITGLVAKEEVVSTFGVLYNYDAKAAQAVDEETGELLFDEDGEPIMEELGDEGEGIWDRVAEDYTPLSAFAFMLFNLLCAPCFAAMGAIKREMNSAKWTWFAIGYECVFAYVVALITYQLGCLFSGNTNVAGLIVAVILLAAMLYLLFRPDPNVKRAKAAAAAA